MRIDASHRRWAAGTAAALAAAVAIHSILRRAGGSAGGGSAAGLAFGIAGFAMMLYAALLGARRRVRIWRIGRAQTWMRGHLWLGLLSLPIVLLHADVRTGAGLTAVLVWLLAVVVLSGIAGAWLQHVLPRRLLREVPMETIYDEIGRVRVQLLDEADRVASGAPEALRDFYLADVRPFVEHPGSGHPLAEAAAAAGRFEKARALMPPDLRPALDDLENICEEERQLIRQARLHRVLHGWLLVHVPLSIALLVLSVVHIVMALRF